jgi:putative OPT family oligopeptide transporter
MASVANGVFQGGLPWTMVIIGGLMAVGIIAYDKVLEARGSTFRAPVLAVAVGIYLPIELSTSIFIGGLIWWGAQRVTPRGGEGHSLRGLLLASGLITGEALVGILLALPIALASWSAFFAPDMFEVFPAPPIGGWPGLVVLIGVSLWLYQAASEPD